MNKRGDIELKDFGTILIIYILLITSVASSTNISISDNSSLPSPEHEPQPEKSPSSPNNSSSPEEDSNNNENENTTNIPNLENNTNNNSTNNTNQTAEPIQNQTNQTSTNSTNQTISENITDSQTITEIINETISTEIETRIELIQGKAKVGETVVWTKRVYTPDSNYEVEIPINAQKLSETFFETPTNTNTFNTQSFSAQSEEEEPTESYIEVEYETPAPNKKEKDLSNGKEVLIWSEEHYKDVSVTTTVDESFEVGKNSILKIYWKEENTYLSHEATDSDNNGIIDSISWTIPHLSNQTFELIVIAQAEHLDSNRKIIENIYSSVSKLDGVYSPTISDGEFVRIVFERFLDSSRDITIYPKRINGTPIIEVYEKDETTKIAEFNPLLDLKKNKIYLTNLIGTQDTFDLKVIGGKIQFDYIVDPIYGPFTFDADNDADEDSWDFVSDNGANGLNPPNTARAWSHDTDDTTSSNVGPTSGQGGSPDGYVYTEMTSPGALGDTFHMTFNTTLDAKLNSWEIEFYWNQRGNDNTATVKVQTNENSAGWVTRGTYAENGPNVSSGGTQIWNYESLDLLGTISDNSTEIRFFVEMPASGTAWHNDFGLDTITITSTPINQTPTTPTSLTCNGGGCNIVVHEQVELNCSGSTDLENDTITYVINDSSGQVGNHTQGNSVIWNTTLSSERNATNFTCVAMDIGGSNKSEGNYSLLSSMKIDHTSPIINFSTGTLTDGVSVDDNFIYINTTITENNFGNITFFLYDENKTYFKNYTSSSVYYHNFTNLANGLYFYNATTHDKAGLSNSTTTKNITLDTTNPYGDTSTPSSGSHSNSNTHNITVDASDALGLKEVVLNVFNSSGFQINQTSLLVSGTIITVGIIYTFLTDGVYTWFYRIIDLADNYYDTANSTITIDTTPSTILLESIMNNSGDTDGDLDFYYNISDELSEIVNCSLIINNATSETDTTITKNISQLLTETNLEVGHYNFTVQCFDEANNLANSELRYFDVISANSFGGATTDFSNTDLTNVSNFTLEDTSHGKLQYIEDVDVSGGLNFDSLVQFSTGSIMVDSASEEDLNHSATIEFYNLNYEFTPVILKDTSICQDCSINSYSAGTLSFNVSSFSNYTSKENSQLFIYDETDSANKYQNEDIKFFANYSNTTNSSPISSADCNITFDDYETAMTYNATSYFFEYNRSFSLYGIHDYTIDCYGSSLGYENLTTSDTATVKITPTNSESGYKTQSGVYSLAGTDEYIPIDFPVSDLTRAFVMAPNQMSQANTTAAGSGTPPALNSDDSFVSLYLYNTTHIRAQRYTADYDVVITWQVLEAFNEEFEVQRGEHSYSGSATNTTVDIPSNVSYENSMSWFYIRTSYTSNNGDKIQFYSNLTDNNTVQFTREDSTVSTTQNFRWIVIEWDTSKIDNFAKGYTGEITGPDTSANCFNIGTTINKTSSILFHQSHATDDTDGGLDSSTRAGYIQSNTQACFYDHDGSFNAGVKWYIIDFKQTTNREEDTHTDWGSTDYIDDPTFTNSYNTNKTLFWLSGTCNGDGTAKPRHTQWWNFSSSAVHIERTYGGQNREYAWQILELPFAENLEAPQFSNYNSNQSYAASGEIVKFSLNVNDTSDSINWTRGIIDGVEQNFTAGSGNEWYYNYTCSGNKNVNFSYVSAQDNGNPTRINSTSVVGVGVICDSTNPLINFVTPDTLPDTSGTNNNFLEIDVNITETNFQNITYKLYNSTDLVNSTTYLTPISTITFENLASEVYSYNVTVYDKAGNKGNTSTWTATIDRDLPQIEYTTGTSPAGTIKKGTNIFINVTVIEDNFKNISFYLYDESMQPERSVLDHTQNYLNWTLLSDGLYYYEVVVWDDYGNTNTSVMRNITLDNVLPVVTYTGSTEDDDTYFPRNYIFAEVTVTETNFVNVTFHLYNSSGLIDNTTFANSVRSINWPGLTDSVYYYNVTSWDKAGNMGSSPTRQLTLDNVDPVVIFGEGTEADNQNFSCDYVFINSSITEINFQNITFHLYPESSGEVTQSFTDSTRDYTFNSLASEMYDYNITVYDKAGNKGTSLTRTIGLDTLGPIINVIDPEPKAYGIDKNLPLNATATDAISSLDSCWWNIDDGTNNSITCNTATTFNTSNGQRTIKYFANDSFGNVGMDSVTFLISTGGPAISLIDPENDTIYPTTTEVLFNYSATDIQGVSSCSLYGTWNGGWHLNQTDYNWSFGTKNSELEDFESASWDNWTLVGDSNGCDYTRSTSTPSGSTGPTGGYGPSPSGSSDFLFTEATSGQNCEYDTGNHWASIESDSLDADTYNITISFWYHMYGAAMGTLSLDVNDSTGWHNNTWNLSGQQQSAEGANWQEAVVNLGSYSGQINLRLRAVVGTAYTSDSSIDEANITLIPKITKEYGNFTVNLSTEGNYDWNVKCNDTLGLNETALYNYSVGIDLTAPVVDFDSGTLPDSSRVAVDYIFIDANVTETNLDNITFNLYENGINIENGTYSDGTLNHTFSSLNDGTYYYNITVYDKAGRVGNSSTRSIEIDTELPSGTLISPEDNHFTNSVTHNFTANVSDSVELKNAMLFIINSTGHVVYTFLIDLAGLTEATIGKVYTFLYDDVFTWFYRIRDSVDNEYNTTSNSIEIDSTEPVITFIPSTETDGAVLLQDFVYVNISIYEKNFNNVTFNLYNGSSQIRGPNTFTDSTREINWTLLSDDVYYYNITSVDLATNIGYSSTRQIILDTTAPAVSFAPNSAANNSVFTGTSIFMNVTVTEPNEENITFYLYSATKSPEGAPKTYTDSRRSINWDLLSEGTYYYNITVFDKVSLSGSTDTRKVTIDNTDPIIDFASPTENDTANKSQTWIFVNTTFTEINPSNITFNLYNTSGLVESQTNSPETTFYNFTGLPDGNYEYNVTIFDKASQNDTTSTRTITLDTTFPTIEFIPPTEDNATIRNRDWVFINTSVTETNFKEIKFDIYDSGGLVDSQTFTNSTREINFTSLPDENYLYNVTVTDWAGNTNSTETRSIGLDGAGPIVTITKPTSKTYGYNESLPLEHTVSDQVSSVDSCWWNIDGGANQSITCNSATTFNTTVDTHTIYFFANDTFGNMGSDSVTFFISITGPAIELIAPSNDSFYGEATNINFSFAATDPDGVDACSLYGDWNGGWHLNETYTGNWSDVGFENRRDINISNTGSSTLTDFPVYLNISTSHTETGDYSDLLFYSGTCLSEGSTSLDYEIEDYSATNANVWIKIPSLTTGANTICMYYANANAENAENATSVWSSSYTSVYHLDHTSGTALDTLGNFDAEDGIDPDSNMDSPGIVGGADYFDGSDYLGTNPEWNVDGAHTYCAWVKFSTGHQGTILEDGGLTDGTGLGVTSAGEFRYAECYNGNFNAINTSASYADNQWHYVCGGHKGAGNDQFLYVNGELISSITMGDGLSGTGNARIGASVNANPVFDDNLAHNFIGTLDEIRISSTNRSTNWINQSYQHIANYDSNIIFGAEQNFTAFDVLISEEGSYKWNVECNDTIGYDSFALENYTFTVDVTDPQVLFAGGTEDNDTDVGRNWVFMDANVIENNFKNITFYLYNSTAFEWSQSFTDDTREYNFTSLASGVYKYNITVYDKANRNGSSTTRIINLDLTAPTGNLVSPSDNSYTNNLTQNLTGTFNDATGLFNATLYIFNETGHLIYTASQALGGAISATVGLIYDFLSEGIYYWFYSVEDTVGNVYNTSNFTLNIDLTLPLINYTFGTEPSGEILEQENIYVNVTVVEDNLDNVTFDLYDSGGQIYSHSFGPHDINWTLLSDGLYFYNVTAYDIAGNSNTTETRNITLDNQAPIIDFSSQNEEDEGFISGDTISVYVNVTEANEENITFYLYNETNSPVTNNTFTDKRRTVSWNLLSEGLYYYNVTIFDVVGKSDSTATRSITIDDTDPVLSYMFPTEDNDTAFARDWVQFKVSSVEDNFLNISLSLYNSTGLVSTESFTDTTREFNWTSLPDGNYWYNATMYDKAGNDGSTTTRTIILDNTNPLIEFVSLTLNDGVNNTNNWIFVNTSVTENNFENITFYLFNSTGEVNSTTYTNQITQINFTNLASNEYWYNVSIYDSAENYNKTETRKIGLDFLGPSIAIINPKAKAYGYNISLPLDYNVNDNIVGEDTCWYNLDDGTNTTVSCSGSETFNTSDGQHTLHFFANDTLGNLNYKNVTFLVSTTGPAIQLLLPEDDTFYSAATEVFFNYTAEDPDLTQSCSLWGDFNGTWHLNQTDYNWVIGESGWENESFETASPWNNWTQSTGDDCDWSRNADNDGTPSGSTGPEEDHTLGTIAGHFIFIEATSGQPCGFDQGSPEAVVESENLDADSNDYNVSFWFHMYGADMGTLHLEINDSSGWNSIWSQVGQNQSGQTNDYIYISRSLSEYEGNIKLRFRSITGSGYRSDMSIDDINITFVPASNKPSGNFTLNLSEEGTSIWNVECNDSLGYYTWAVSNYSITFDVTDPVVDFGANTLPDNSNVSQSYIYINSSIIENNFKNITFYIYNSTGLVSSQWFNDSTRNYTFTGLDDGTYYYNITVFDSANRNGSSSTREILLDTTPPGGNLISPSDNTITNNATQNLTGNFSDDNGLKEVILYIYNQTGFVYSQLVSLNGVLSATVGIVYEFLLDGIYTWFYQAEDTIGNLYNTTNYTITIDTTLPTIDFIPLTLNNNTYVSQDYIYLNTSVVETNFENITFKLFNGEGEAYSYTFSTSKRDINWTLLSDDEYFYNVTVWDSAENVNTSETRIITLDNIAPTISYSTGTEIDTANVSQNFVFVNTTITEINFANITFNLYDGGGLINSTTYNTSIKNINWTGLFDDEYFYNVTIFDKAGLTNSLPTRKITLDKTAPLVDFAGSTAPSGSQFERDWIYVDSNVVEANFKNMSYRLYDNDSQIINETTFYSVVNDINFTASGENNTYYYDIIVWDYANNFGVTSTRNITLIDITSPTLVLTSPENITYPYNNGIRLEYDVYDVHLDTCWYSLDGAANTTLPNCQSISMNFVDETGHTINLYVNDTMGYMNSSNVTFFVNSSLIETPTYKVLSGSTFVDGNATETIEITDMSKSFILHTSRASDNGPDTLQIISKFSKSNEVTFSNYNTGAGAIVDWNLISGPDIEVQRGEISFSYEANLSLNIGQVNLSNSFVVVYSKLSSGNSADNVEGFFTGEFIDDSNVVFRRDNGTSSGVLSWQVVSWDNTDVQSGNTIITDGNSDSGAVSISAVNLNESFIIFSDNLIGDDSVEDSFIKGNFSDSSNLIFNRRGTSGNASINYFVITSDLFNSQREDYNHLISSSEQIINLQHNLINTERSFNIHSNDNDGATTTYANAFVTQAIKNTTSLSLQKGVGSSAGTTSWFAVEIKDLNSPTINLTSPIDNYNYTSHTVGPFNFTIDDESNMTNCSLYGTWNGGWHLNQTIYSVNAEVENNFSMVDVGTSNYYNWSVICFDIYGNNDSSTNYTFSSFLPPSMPEFMNITQSANNGTGSIILEWNESLEVVKYKVYSSPNVTDFTLMNETTELNYTDDTFSGNKRRFYKVEAWNPSGTNISDYTFGAHVYGLKHNTSAVHSIKNRNWIAFPTNFTYLKNANDTLNEIIGAVAVSQLNKSSQKQVTCNTFSCPETISCTDTACNFELVAGAGYEISLNVSESSQVNWSGVGVVYDPIQIPLVYDETGTRMNKNWISMTAGTTMTNAQELTASLLGEDAVTRWDPEFQISQGYLGEVCFWFGCIPLGTNFNITMEEGYEISVTQDSAWTQQ